MENETERHNKTLSSLPGAWVRCPLTCPWDTGTGTKATSNESHLLTPLVPSELGEQRKGGKGACQLLNGRRHITK